MNKQHMQAIADYLDKQGVSFEPLREEMLDHIGCDVERLMQTGSSFEEAWQKILNEIPPKQLYAIQIETMETINKKEALSKWFAYLSFFLLFAGSVFKLMKFPGAGQLLISSFIAIALALLSGSIFGISANKEKKGTWLLVGILGGILLFLASFTFQILHLPGATEFRIMAVTSLCITYPLSFFYLSLRGNKDNILSWLHARYTPAIERFLLILFAAAVVMRMPSLAIGYEDFVSRILLVIAIAATGLHFHSLTWHTLSNDGKPAMIYLTALSTSAVCFLLPALIGFLSQPLREGLGVAFWPIAGTIAAIKGTEERMRLPAFVVTGFVTVLSLAWSPVISGFFPISVKQFVFHAVVLGALLILLALFRKSPLYRMFMVLAISHYLFAYPWESGLW